MRNPDSLTAQLAKFFKTYAGWAYLPFAGISAVTDAGSVVLAHGYRDVIAAGREIIAQSGLYITKKRYAALVIDNEGFRTDIDGKPGKVKAMGLDLRRSDTPVFMQEFLSEILLMVLTTNLGLIT